MKSAVFERQHGDLQTALSLLSTALKSFPKFPKLYMIQGQIHQGLKNYNAARASFSSGLKACPKEPVLWILASRLEEADGKSIKARALLDKARVVNVGVDTLWAEACALEERAGGAAQAKSVLSRGLKECRNSGLLWSMAIWAEPRPSRKARSADAIRACGNDPLLLCTVARLLWAERKIEKAREWFKRAISEAASKDMDVGDVWGWWLKFEREHGTTVRVYTLISSLIFTFLVAFVSVESLIRNWVFGIIGTSRGSYQTMRCCCTAPFACVAIHLKRPEECGKGHKTDSGDGCAGVKISLQ